MRAAAPAVVSFQGLAFLRGGMTAAAPRLAIPLELAAGMGVFCGQTVFQGKSDGRRVRKTASLARFTAGEAGGLSQSNRAGARPASAIWARGTATYRQWSHWKRPLRYPNDDRGSGSCSCEGPLRILADMAIPEQRGKYRRKGGHPEKHRDGPEGLLRDTGHRRPQNAAPRHRQQRRREAE